MKKKIALLTLAFVCLACLFTLTACNDENPLDFVTGQGNTIAVYYDEMMGKDPVWWQIKEGSPLPEPGVTANVKKPERAGYVFLGYYEGEKDATTGEVTYGNKWDFSTKVSQSITLYAKWEKQYTIHINYVVDGQVVGEGESMIIENNASQVVFIKEPRYTGNTFLEMYSDATLTNVLAVSSANPFVHGCTQDEPTVEVYAKFIPGNWTLVRTANDMRNISAGGRYYLLNDVDFAELNNKETGLTSITINRGTFIGAIEGNGYAIKNLHFRAEGTKDTKASANNFGLFAKLDAKASITNVTFENCSVVGEINRENAEYFYGFLAGSADANCTLNNITLKNCQVKPMTFGEKFVGDNETMLQRVEQKLFIAEYNGTYSPNVVND